MRLAYSRDMGMPAADGSPDAETDEALMLAYAHGDAAAFDTLYQRHRGGVYRYLARQCGQARIADELFQDVWMNVIRARESYVPTARFTTWIYRIARHRLVDHWRAQGAERGTAGARSDEDDDAVISIAAQAADEPETRVAARELRACLDRALAALPPAQRDAFLLQQEGGLALAEIAALTAVGEATVKSRLRYAHARLRIALDGLR